MKNTRPIAGYSLFAKGPFASIEWSLRRSATHGLQGAEYLFLLGKASGLLLGEDLLTISDDLEDTPVRLNQLRLYAKSALDRVRQTDGFRPVVSNHAIFD
jgi:hypothetical protein